MLTFVCCNIFGIEFAPLIAVVVGITNIIPVFGPFIGAIPCLLILVFVNPFDALKFLILIIAIQQVDGNIIGPKILGKSIGVSALWVLVAIVIGGDFAGGCGHGRRRAYFCHILWPAAPVYRLVPGAPRH